jgi:hypothetical protein
MPQTRLPLLAFATISELLETLFLRVANIQPINQLGRLVPDLINNSLSSWIDDSIAFFVSRI